MYQSLAWPVGYPALDVVEIVEDGLLQVGDGCVRYGLDRDWLAWLNSCHEIGGTQKI